MNSISELKKIISNENNCIELIQYIIFKYIEYFYYDFFIVYNIKLFTSETNLFCYDEKIFKIFKIYSSELKSIPLGEIYESIIPMDAKKKFGQVYTPEITIDGILDNTLTQDKYLCNPYLKILDPACGSGYFLIRAYLKIKSIFLNNKIFFYEKYKIDSNNIDEHILNNNIHGYDIDNFSCILSKINLGIISKCSCKINIKNEDFLFSDDEQKYNLIIGNPPYIGHKNLNIEYKKKLKEKFKVYNDKSDISYCFFEKCFDKLEKHGELSFITSRYFIEANYAKELRNYIKEKYNIKSLIDYSGINLFKNTGVSPIIINLTKDEKYDDINVLNISNEKKFIISQKNLDSDNWKLLDKDIIGLFEKIKKQSGNSIGDFFNLYQGIITGMDRAFVVDDKIIEEYDIEKEVIVNWIKGSTIKKFNIEDTKKLKLIYTNGNDMEKYPNTRKYLHKNEEKLSNRRECLRGYRNWYDLQWGRNKELFMEDKIIFPYKSSGNFFAHDKNNYFFSADIYMMLPKNDDIILENSLYYLNSEIFEFLVKITSKKIGRNLFEYYPYNINKLPFFNKFPISFETYSNYDNIYMYYNEYIYEYLKINQKEIDLIKNFIINS